jgi:ribosomal protein S18 acetylase RimI-like enzyme
MLNWDAEFFGVRIAQVEGDRLTDATADQVLQWSRDQQIACLYFLCASDDDESVRIAERNQFHMVDIRMELSWRVKKVGNGSVNNTRPFQRPDLPTLQEIAASSYELSRFYFDRRFDRAQSSALYREWITKSCDGYADAVFVAPHWDSVGGFITCHLDSPERGRIGLVGVSEDARGAGVGRALIETAQSYFFDKGASEVFVVTQGRNIAAQRLYQAAGFRTHSMRLWYHIWLS